MSQQDRESPRQMSSEDIALLGLSLGYYQIEDFYARGSVAATFRGSEMSSEQTVAVKILKKSPATDYFMARSTKIKELEHPAIAKVYDVAFEQQCNGYYVVSQWIDGCNLEDTLTQEGQISIQDALIVVMNISHALDYAHTQGVAHGNLKASNILFTSEGETVITDFGIVPYKQEPGKAPVLGMEEFMAPEQFKGNLPGFATDMYSLGCILWQLIVGALPNRKFGEFPDIRTELKSAGLELDDNLIACLEKMVFSDPMRRFSSMGEVTEELEKIYSSVHTVECPLCGKQNSTKEVFKCYECETANLCLSHLRQEKQCCERCYGKMQANVTQQMIKPSAKNRPKLTAFVEHITKQGLLGVLVLASKTSLMGVNITSDAIELCLEKMPEGISGESPLKSEKAFYRSLAEFLTWKEFSFEFWEGKEPARVLPQAKVRIVSTEGPTEFLPPFCRLLQMWNEIQEEGGAYFYGKGMSCGMLFSKRGVMVISPVPEKGKATTILTTERTALWVLQSLFRAPWERIEYRMEHSFPSDKPRISSPLKDFCQIAADRAMWESILHIPTIDTLLPATLQWNNPFGGIELTTLAETVYRKLYESLCVGNLDKSASSLAAMLMKASVAKKRLRQISDILVETAQNHYDKWEAETTETILLQAEKLFPEHTEVSQLLGEFYEYIGNSEKAASYYTKAGDVHWTNKEQLKALACYQQAIEFDSQLVMPRLRLIEIYDKTNQKEKIKGVAESAWSAWQNVKKENEKVTMDTMENVCQILVKQDCASGACYWELANIMLMKDKKQAALKLFETLVPIYRKEGNRQGQIRAMAQISQLKPGNAKIVEKLEKMQGKDWKKILTKPNQHYAFPGIKTQPTNPQLLKIYFGKSPAIKFGVVACVGLLLAAIFFPMFFSSPAPPANIPRNVSRTHTRPKIAQNRPSEQENEQRDENEENQKKERQLRELWQKAQQLKKGKKYTQAKEYCEKIIVTGGETWKEKATEEIKLLRKTLAEIPVLERQKAYYDEGIYYREQGLYADALKMYEQACREAPENETAAKARQEIEWIEGKETQTQRMIANAKSMINRGRYAEAVDRCYRVLDDKYMIHCKAAEKIVIPLLIETSPVSAKLSANSQIEQKSIGQNLLIYHKPGTIPEVQVKRKGFKEKERHFQKSPAEHVWKMEIILEYVPLWEFSTKGAIGAITVDNEILYFGSRDGHAYGVDINGKKRLDFFAGRLDDITGGLLITEDSIFFGTHTGHAFAVDKNNGMELWSMELGKEPIHSTPRTSGPYLCFTLENGIMWFVEENDNESRWKYSLKKNPLNSPVKYARDRIVVATRSGRILALRPAKKKVEWRKQAKYGKKRVKLLAGPKVAARRIYVTSERGQIIGWNFRGEKRLEIKTGKKLAPVLAVGRKYILVADQKNSIYCWNSETKKLAWAKELSSRVKYAILLKDTVYIIGEGKELLAMNVKTGRLLWIYKTKKVLDSQPFIFKNILYAGSKDGTLQAYNLDQ